MRVILSPEIQQDLVLLGVFAPQWSYDRTEIREQDAQLLRVTLVGVKVVTEPSQETLWKQGLGVREPLLSVRITQIPELSQVKCLKCLGVVVRIVGSGGRGGRGTFVVKCWQLAHARFVALPTASWQIGEVQS